MSKLFCQQKLTIRESFVNFFLSAFQPGEELLPQDAKGEIILDVVDIRDTWEVCTAVDNKHCVARQEPINTELEEMDFVSLTDKSKAYHNAQSYNT